MSSLDILSLGMTLGSVYIGTTVAAMSVTHTDIVVFLPITHSH